MQVSLRVFDQLVPFCKKPTRRHHLIGLSTRGITAKIVQLCYGQDACMNTIRLNSASAKVMNIHYFCLGTGMGTFWVGLARLLQPTHNYQLPVGANMAVSLRIRSSPKNTIRPGTEMLAITIRSCRSIYHSIYCLSAYGCKDLYYFESEGLCRQASGTWYGDFCK